MSINGIPVILDDYGNPYHYRAGLEATLDRLGWSKDVAALNAGYETSESQKNLWSMEIPPIPLLEALAEALQQSETGPESE